MRFAYGALLIAGLFALSGCNEKKPVDKEFVSPDGLFRVYMPGRPHADKQKFAGGPSTIYSVEHLNRAYAVGVSEVDIPEGESEDQIQTRLAELTREQLSLIRAKLTDSKPVTLGKFIGLDIQADLPDDEGILRGRTFIANNRLYRVLCVANDDLAFSKESERFLDSFRIVAPD
jgi:hypothetical protein